MPELRERFRALDGVATPDLDEVLRREPRLATHPGPRQPLSLAIAFAIAAIGLALAARAFMGRGSDRPAAPSGGAVVFSSNLDGDDLDLYAMNEDGSGLRRLTDLPWHEIAGGFSPDGSKIAFSREAAAFSEVYVVNADGTDMHAITDLESQRGSAGIPQWSPDGTTLLFTAFQLRGESGCLREPSGCGSGPDEIYLVTADGSDLRKLATGDMPTWSPDGTRIAFFRGEGEGSLHTINRDGTGEQRVTPAGVAVSDTSHLSWSPDGTRVAFTRFELPSEVCSSGSARECFEESYLIDVARSDGSEVSTLAPGSDPVWSPDGERIAFSRSDGLYVMSADGSGITKLADAGRELIRVSWSPDGQRIAFSELLLTRDAFYGPLFVVNADGSGLRRFTSGASEATEECCLLWSSAASEDES